MNAANLDRQLLEDAVASLPDDGIGAIRQDAANRFLKNGFPALHQEDWKYTNLAAAAELSNAWLASAQAQGAATQDADNLPDLSAITDAIEAHWLALHNGVVHGDMSASADAAGIEISRISADDADLLGNDEALASLNTALLRDGLKLSLAEGVTARSPIGVLVVDDPGNAVTQTRIIVDLAENSALQLVELHLSAAEGEQFTNSVVQVRQSPGSRLDHVRIQDRSLSHTGINRLETVLARDAKFTHTSVDLGGSLTRNDVIADISGANAAVSLSGLYLASDDQHIDNHTKITHAVGPATSIEEYRGIAAGNARCVFNGKVIVAEGADGTDSSQSNHNLLLSDHAEVDTKPELEIYADDVKCAHGATVGQLDESALFYLQTRGLDKLQARQVLTKAFAAVALTELAVPASRELVESLMERRLEHLTGKLA